MSDHWSVYGVELHSRLFLGTAGYPSPAILQQSVHAAKTQVVTTSLRRQSPQEQGGKKFWEKIQKLGCHVLPNTAGCHTAKEAVTMALMSREIFETDWVKLEVTGDEYNLQPDPYQLLEATEELIRRGLRVFAYTTDDLVVCTRLRDLGCKVVMPWGAPIGTGRGVLNPYALSTLRDRLPDVALVLDAGIGLPSHAAQAMELGLDGILLNSAVAQADEPGKMAAGMRYAVIAGRLAYLAGPMATSDAAQATTPNIDRPFWHQQRPTNGDEKTG